MTDENKAISVNRWRLVLGGMSDKSLSFTGNKAEIATFRIWKSYSIISIAVRKVTM